MRFFRKIICRVVGHKLDYVRMRELQVVNRLNEHSSIIVVEHTFRCVRCQQVAYRESMAAKEKTPFLTMIKSFGPAKWTGLEK